MWLLPPGHGPHAAPVLPHECRSAVVAAGLVDEGLAAIHADRANTLRLSNYFPRQAGVSCAPRCGEHKDFGTFTVLFQAGTDLCTLCRW